MVKALRILCVIAGLFGMGWFSNEAWRLHQVSRELAAAPAAPSAPRAPAPAAAPPAAKLHRYEVRDGMSYGYTQALSADDRASGRAAPTVLMFRFAGERNGRIQVHAADGLTFTALECEKPCRVIKSMTFVDSDFLRDQVRVEHLAYQPGSVAGAVIDDALAGELKPYGVARGNKAFQIWVDEGGRREFVVAPPKNAVK